jgi:hypothetical protein
MSVLVALYKRCTWSRAPHLWLAIIGILLHLAISIVAPMFEPDRGFLRRLLSYSRLIVVASYVSADLLVLSVKWWKLQSVKRHLTRTNEYAIHSDSDLRRDAFRTNSFPFKTLIHLVFSFILFAAEDNLFQSVIGFVQ